MHINKDAIENFSPETELLDSVSFYVYIPAGKIAEKQCGGVYL